MHLIIALGSGRDVDIGGVLAVVFRLTQLSLMAPVCFHKLSIKSGHASEVGLVLRVSLGL